MCVILYKAAGQALPSTEILDACWDANPDGFGVMYTDPAHPENGVTIHKGAMKKRDAKKLYSLVKQEYNAVYHWRIGTSGGNTKANCHPFPVTQDLKEMQSLNHTCLPCAVAHNGIISHPKGNVSDTMLWIRDNLMYAVSYLDRDRLALWLESQAELYHSRFAFLFADGEVVLAGEWHDYEGYKVSNTAFAWHVNSYRYGAGYYNDSSVCPVCHSDTTYKLGSLQDLYECQDCGAVFNPVEQTIMFSLSYEEAELDMRRVG